MDLDFDDSAEEFRTEVREFLAANKQHFPTESYDTAAGFEQHRRWDTVLNTKGRVSKPPGWAKPIWGLTRTTTAIGSTAANAPAAQTEPGRVGGPVFRPHRACGPGKQLGANRAGQALVQLLPFVCPD